MLGNYGDVMCNYDVFSFDFPLTSYFCNADFTLNNDIIYIDNSQSGGGNGGGGDNPEVPDEEDNILVNILSGWLLPTEEQVEEIRDYYEDTIMSKFGLQNYDFDNDLDNENIFLSDFPVFRFTILQTDIEFETEQIATMLNTPISFGHRRDELISDNETTFWEPVATGGLTPKKIISILFAIEVFYFNIVMYNRFLGGGDSSL